jgi:hypothetical protein
MQRSPPKTKMELAMQMTGRERRQYTEWKSEREKVDQSRVDRSKNNSGDWKRAWDVEKKDQ